MSSLKTETIRKLVRRKVFKNGVAVSKDVAALLQAAATTYTERNAVYGSNYENVAKVMLALFPNGVNLTTPEHYKVFHLLELIVVKLTRFCNSDLTHGDSIHDVIVYAALIESLNHEGGLK